MVSVEQGETMMTATETSQASKATNRRWIKLFREGNAKERDLLGGKGANLAEMTNIGLPVPPGFTVTTEACKAFLDSDSQVPEGLWDELESALASIEQEMGRSFGDPGDPLLLSVRSGAKFSMPGMMETVLNLGLNDDTVAGLAKQGGERFAYDAYRRLVQMFGKVVLGVNADAFESALHKAKESAGVSFDHELSADQLKMLVETFEQIVSDHGKEFPQEPREQLRQSVLAVFHSWNTPRARAYRKSSDIPETLGTAVNVQVMVFGNTGPDSASGVAFTRNPSTGAQGMFGEYLPNAQGEDVVSGVCTPRHVEEMGNDPEFRQAYEELLEIGDRLERHYRDMQDVEFTVERGKLWMLQTRTGKRTASAAVRMAVEMVHDELIDQKTAVLRVQPEQIELLLHPRVDDEAEFDVIAEGLPASPGAASGAVVFDPSEAKERGERGEPVILVRRETSAEDFPGMERSMGILTAHGGMTSHAAVVARGIGKPAVTGCSAIAVDYDQQQFTVDDRVVAAGDIITLDGSTGRVILGEAPTIRPEFTDDLNELLSWSDQFRRLGVRANADLPEDAEQAREFGAEGIGLCRTEHMFFAPERIMLVRSMILAENAEDRKAALDALEPLQTGDFAELFRVMDGHPVTIRLLDPPLHEFLPESDEDQERMAEELGISVEQIQHAVETHREVNPMLGTRGVRLGMLYPDITRMQARAIINAAVQSQEDGIEVEPEIMVPLVSEPEELRRQHELIDETANEIFERTGKRVQYQVGTMIEVPRAALMAETMAQCADFFSFGTNDLTQMTFGLSRDDSETFLPTYVEQGILPADPFQILDQKGVGRLIELASSEGRAANANLKVGICGEHGGEPRSVAYCDRIGLDYVSCSPFRLPVARLSAAHAALGSMGAEDR
jgi:pyruvate, orthophosphate dikinase